MQNAKNKTGGFCIKKTFEKKILLELADTKIAHP